MALTLGLTKMGKSWIFLSLAVAVILSTASGEQVSDTVYFSTLFTQLVWVVYKFLQMLQIF